MEFLSGVIVGAFGVIGGVILYFEITYRRNKKKIWKGRL